MSQGTILIIGGGGKTGARVNARLRARGIATRPVSRSTETPFDWERPEGWAKGEDGETKTDASDGYVPLHPVLAGYLRVWQQETPHAKADDFVFPSIREKGFTPLVS